VNVRIDTNGRVFLFFWGLVFGSGFWFLVRFWFLVPSASGLCLVVSGCIFLCKVYFFGFVVVFVYFLCFFSLGQFPLLFAAVWNRHL
jgi:hypothetical protein